MIMFILSRKFQFRHVPLDESRVEAYQISDHGEGVLVKEWWQQRWWYGGVALEFLPQLHPGAARRLSGAVLRFG